MRPSVDGALDMAALAQLHRPRTRKELRAAVHELAARGITDYAVRRMLGEHRGART